MFLSTSLLEPIGQQPRIPQYNRSLPTILPGRFPGLQHDGRRAWKQCLVQVYKPHLVHPFDRRRNHVGNAVENQRFKFAK